MRERNKFRNSFIKKRNIHFGLNPHISFGVKIHTQTPLHFGDNVRICKNVTIRCLDDIYELNSHDDSILTIIGDNVVIGGNLTLFSGAVIGNNCIFGSGHIIVYPRVTIGRNCVMCRNCIVKSDVPDDALVTGSHGLIIRKTMF